MRAIELLQDTITDKALEIPGVSPAGLKLNPSISGETVRTDSVTLLHRPPIDWTYWPK
jgi:hypothetical protein